MNETEISKLQSTLEGAYPTSKISPTKVFELWRMKRELLDFPNARRADLVNRVLEVCKDFPTLPQLLACIKDVAPPERVVRDTCLICDDTGWIHYEENGDPIDGQRRTKVVAGRELVFQHQGVDILYHQPRPCPACSH